MSLTPNHTVEEVAAALGETAYYVQTKCRAREWPHCRGARGRVSFTAEHFNRILELIAEPEASAEAQPRFSFAPRSGRRSA
jgi:hypothetical protein